MGTIDFDDNSFDSKRHATGMTANGSSGYWDVEIDETLSGDEKWFLQIDGPRFYVNFEIQAPSIVKQVLTFVDRKKTNSLCAASQNGELKLGHFMRTPVTLLWDDESGSRCILLIGGTGDSKLRFTFEQKDLADLTEAFRQVENDLYDEGLLSEAS